MARYVRQSVHEQTPAPGAPMTNPQVVEQPVAQQPVAQPVVQQPIVEQQPVVRREYMATEPTVAQSDQMVSRSWSSFSASQVIHGLCGFVLIIMGALAVANGGFGSPINDQTSNVLGIQHTTVIGLVEIGVGLLLIIAALTPSGRYFGGFIGALLIVAGFILIAGTDKLLSDLHTERALGWVALVLGVLSLIAAFLPERVASRRRYTAVR